MTNIATMFCTYPDAADLLKGLYVMNGYFGKEPLPDPYYNWNSWADPLASKIVFSTRTAITGQFRWRLQTVLRSTLNRQKSF
ncbi:MAG: nucleoside hydrolase [Sellimonas sp.]|uniref:nucleoside hydrolase n=1 Tax=Sellimonas sp. TaxID=2021466 RepID=UPI0039A3A68B